MMAGTKSIFIGDHQQMPPVILTEHEPEWVSSSIFERLYQHSPGTMLNTTYRMNKEINEFPSKAFYGGRLKIDPGNVNSRLDLQRAPSIYNNILNPDIPDVFVEVRHKKRGMRSPEEAEIAAKLVIEAVSCGIPANEIAVIAPYRAQGRLIRRLIYENCGHMSHVPNDCVVDTVERIQGQERDMIIISLTTSDPEHASQRAEFFFQPNRLNVAITRPRVKRIVLGSPLLFKARSKDKEIQENINLFYEFYKQSKIIKLR
jgi:DNA replication ATP-dependent helicase Dna2